MRKLASDARLEKHAGRCEHIVVLERDSQLPTHTETQRAAKHQRPVLACEHVRHNGIVTPAIVERSLAAVNDPTHFAEMRRRLSQMESDLVSTVEREAHAAIDQLNFVPLFTRKSAAAAAIVRCGLFVADAIQRGHLSLWESS
ncbi:MAG TPA: hypothetical protein VF595_09020 [Tepidisphaeraceae bacterium]